MKNLNRPCSTMTIELIRYIQNNPNTVHHMDAFLARYQTPIFNFVRLTVGHYHDSYDLTNKILLTLSKKVKEIREKKAFNALALMVIKGEISNYWKGKKTKKAQLMRQATIYHNDEHISLLSTLESNEKKAEEVLSLLVIRDLIENAEDPLMKKVFALRYRDDESIESIVNKLGITDYQVKKYLKKIHDEVKSYLEEEEQ
ncbi:sigma-70 family RNA polymerase sigma factor [Candidatus Uabimicrobium sp. HlEnr_7]|uniref:sigma-70 family RNA polymerase sigma factor n=1 Tax=Candidatus Uabimicrobium helgolandensis TaxID=3095367 RepID=UPI00355681E4